MEASALPKLHETTSEGEDAPGFHDVATEEQRRGSIAVAFIGDFDAPSKVYWGGEDGTASLILEILRTPRFSRRGLSCSSGRGAYSAVPPRRHGILALCV